MAFNNILTFSFYKRFNFLIVVRLALLFSNIIIIERIFGNEKLFFTQIILALILIIQLLDFVRFINQTNRELARFFLAIKHSDFTITFNQRELGKSFSLLQESMISIINSYKDVKIEKEAQFHFLQMLINQIRVGIIALEENDIILINTTVEEILHTKSIKNWKLLQQLRPDFTNLVHEVGENGRKLLEIKTDGINSGYLSVDVGTSYILGKETKLITFQNIASEIEQKEIEAWHKLIRILTHEIMNSVTPISSLTETIQMMLNDRDGNQRQPKDLTQEIINDIRFSLSTIQKRTDGLLQFTEDYRKLTRIPKPKREPIILHKFFNTIIALLRPQLEEKNIEIKTNVGSDLMLVADPILTEQVLINLLTNSIYALNGRKDPKIELKGYREGSSIVIAVTDNGKGIGSKEISHIFTPFFTTRKDGSGIGLSLSKQIMSDHGGTIKVGSEVDQGTTMLLLFKS
ncbi:sensor histidine kinase [Chryseosolibacter indicus]|uniref:histidine kinase n=1 Tax=Chryseosolibacter indicus TaxID=2782351 RepID=A0ABS5VUG0_9BACT|nr:HAMP domain-containing sensor histidine kinase [Chryseosolibacter indicus]MBT1705073.1 HAMP domain-containing histidine kinase [Chryseosolibacter indicus]